MAKVRLIDADKLLGVFCTDCGMRDGSCSNSCEKDCAVYDTITSAPTVKAQPTKPMLDLNTDGKTMKIARVTCEECGFVFPVWVKQRKSDTDITTYFCCTFCNAEYIVRKEPILRVGGIKNGK